MFSNRFDIEKFFGAVRYYKSIGGLVFGDNINFI